MEKEASNNMPNVKVSVVVPIYNVEPYLRECLDSLKRQTLKEIEVIMVNDGSTDSSGIIAEEYAVSNGNFQLIERPNGGLSAARNTGMLKASGEYIYFLDSDDYLVDTALETLYEKAEKHDLDVLMFTGYVFNDGSKEMQWKREGGYKYNGEYPRVYKGIDILKMFIENGDTDLTSCCMIFIRNTIVRKFNLSFVEGIINEDNLFFLQLISVCERAKVLDQPLYCRRIRPNSITAIIDYRLKASSMLASVEAADEFYDNNPEYHSMDVEWYIGKFLLFMMYYWENMSRELRCNPEIKKLYSEMKPIAERHKYCHNWRMKMFITNRPLFRVYLFMRKIKRIG